MDIFDKIEARDAMKITKIVRRKAYTVCVGGRDVASRIMSRTKASKIARRLRKAGMDATPRLFGFVNLTEAELARFA